MRAGWQNAGMSIRIGVCFLVCSFATTARAATYDQEILADSPDAWWRLGELSGTSAVDASGNGNGGTYVNGPIQGVAGALVADPDTATRFDGVNDYVSVPDFPSRYGLSSFTFEAWFRTTTGGVVFGYQNAGAFGTPNNYVPALYVGTDGRLYGKFWAASSILSTGFAVNDGWWHHAAIVVTPGNVQTLYVDGVVIGSMSDALNHLDMTFAQIGTGYGLNWPSTNGGWYNFQGDIDEVAFYGTALSQARLQAHYLAATTAPVPEPATTLLFAGVLPLLRRRCRRRV